MDNFWAGCQSGGVPVARGLGVGAWEWDLVAGAVSWSAELREIYGIAQDRALSAGLETFSSLVHPDDRVRAVETIRETLATGRSGHAHRFRILRPDGGLRYILSRARLFLGGDGVPVRMAGVGIDVTEDRDEHLAELETIYRAAPVGLGLFDRKHRFMRLNEALAEINGVALEDHIGRIAWEVVPSLREAAEPLFERVFQTGQPITDIEFSGETAAAPGATRHWVEHLYPIRAGGDGVSHVAVVVEEVTARKRAEEALRRSEAELRARVSELETLIATSPVGISLSRDPECREIWVNPALRELLGLPGDPEGFASGMAVCERPYVMMRDGRPLADDERPMRQACATGRPVVGVEVELVRADGRRLTLLKSAAPLFDGDGRASGAIAFNIDITERKRHEERIALLMQEVGHRSRNLLSVVQSVARLSAGRDAPGDLAERLVQRIEALSAAHDLVVRGDWTSVDLAELVRSQLGHLDDLVGTRIRLEGPPVTIQANAARGIGMALHELATNAMKYGALSNEAGQALVAWSHVPGPEGRRFRISWTEKDGPAVAPPGRRGFGRTVIETMAAQSVQGEARLDYRPAGIVWTLDAPAAQVVAGPAAMRYSS